MVPLMGSGQGQAEVRLILPGQVTRLPPTVRVR